MASASRAAISPTFTVFITRRENLLTITTMQEDPIYLTEPHVVSRVWEFDPRGSQGPLRDTCNVGVEIPSLEDTGEVPHYLPGQNPEADYMVRTYNIPKRSGDGVRAHALSRVSQDAAVGVHAASVVRPLLLWMDRATGIARRGSGTDVQRRQLAAGTEENAHELRAIDLQGSSLSRSHGDAETRSKYANYDRITGLHNEHLCGPWRSRRITGACRRMRKFGTYLPNWTKSALSISAAGSAACDGLPSLVWAIAHLHLRS